jgi:bifunctional UDP-N-acetylglucosamine pyrophosphorylase/glucosamine-1-phosphate N-acetyltransferase
VAAHVHEVDAGALVADQDEVKGTGRAVACGPRRAARHRIGRAAGPAGTVVVTYGDVPLLTADTLRELVAAHEQAGAAVTVLTAEVDDPAGYGRVLRDADGEVTGIVEHKDADASQLAVREVNSGIYAFDGAVLADALGRVGTDNAQGEVYLTDVLAIARGDGRRVVAATTGDVWQVEGVNDRVQLATLGAELNHRVLTAWMRAGVTVVDPATTWVDVTVELAPDVTLRPGTQLHGATRIAGGAAVGPDTTLLDCEVGPGADVVRTHGTGRDDRRGRHGGPVLVPAARHRAGRARQDRCVRRDEERHDRHRSKVPHLSYVGDAEIGEHTEHRRGHGLRELRRRAQAPDRGRRPRPGGQRHDARGARGDRRRCLHGRRLRGRRRRTRGGDRRRPCPAAQHRGLGGTPARGDLLRGGGRPGAGPGRAEGMRQT